MGFMTRFASAMTWADRLMILGVMVALSVGVVFSVSRLDRDPPATIKHTEEILEQVETNQDLVACRGEVMSRYFYAFALSALVELNGGYPGDIPIATRNHLPDIEDLPALLVEASLDVASLATPETPDGPGILCPLE